LLDTGLQKFA